MVDMNSCTLWCLAVSSGNENKRQSAIYELIQTEEAYMADLKLVYDVSEIH